jgi:hypothetical protein
VLVHAAFDRGRLLIPLVLRTTVNTGRCRSGDARFWEGIDVVL